jgi:non-ribosomal peptide synthetase component F
LHAVRETTLSAYAHQDLPFEQLVEVLQPERSLSYSPLFQVMFSLQHANHSALSSSELQVKQVRQAHRIAKFDLSLILEEQSNQERLTELRGFIEYNTDLFEVSTIAGMWQHLVSILEQATQSLNNAIKDIQVLSQEEEHQLLFQWNEAMVDNSFDQAIHELIAVHVANTPDAIAVISEDLSLSYEALNNKANILAETLLASGVSDETLVGIYLPTSCDMIVSLLATLKSGAVYVPLVLNEPEARVLGHCQSAQIHHVICRNTEVKVFENAEVHCISPESPAVSSYVVNKAKKIDVMQLACVIHSDSKIDQQATSISHQSIVNLVLNNSIVHSKSGDVLLQCAPFNQATSLLEIWGTLLKGATLKLPQKSVYDRQHLIDTIKATEINSLVLPDSLFNDLFSAEQGCFNGLSHLTLSGNKISTSHLNCLIKNVPKLKLTYVNSCLEMASVYTTNTLVQTHDTEGDIITSKGTPVTNTQIYILDKYLRLVPRGVVGELYVAGVGLSRGYYCHPELTAEYFIPNPWGQSDRLYRTGNLVRHCNDGSIEILGRSDQQVNLAGYDVNLEVIESIIASCEQVKEATVQVFEDIKDNGHIVENSFVAFVTSIDGENLKHSSSDVVQIITSLIDEILPQYMRPDHVKVLPTIPFNDAGEIDHSSLAQTLFSEVEDNDALQTKTEMQLAEIWRAILDLEEIRRCDDFFDKKGASLAATQLNVRIQDKFSVETTVKDIFLTPVLKDQAELIDSLLWITTDYELSEGKGIDWAESYEEDSEEGLI